MSRPLWETTPRGLGFVWAEGNPHTCKPSPAYFRTRIENTSKNLTDLLDQRRAPQLREVVPTLLFEQGVRFPSESRKHGFWQNVKKHAFFRVSKKIFFFQVPLYTRDLYNSIAYESRVSTKTAIVRDFCSERSKNDCNKEDLKIGFFRKSKYSNPFFRVFNENPDLVEVFGPPGAPFVYVTVRFWTLESGVHKTYWEQKEVKKAIIRGF